MKVFGMKRAEPTDADRAAATRLSAVAARFKGAPTYDLTDSSPDPIGAPDGIEQAVSEPEAPAEWQASRIEEASEEPETPVDSQDSDREE